jgi:hypothetical protein
MYWHGSVEVAVSFLEFVGTAILKLLVRTEEGIGHLNGT